MNKILDIINEEIDRVISKNIRNISMLLEQDPNALAPAPAPDPAATPAEATPATPATPATADPATADPATTEADKEFDALKKKIADSADIKTVLQNAFQEKSPEDRRSLYDKLISDQELLKKPDKILKIKKFIDMYSEDIKKLPAPVKVNPTPAPAPATAPVPATVAESKLQKSIKDYLHYKRLYNRIGIK